MTGDTRMKSEHNKESHSERHKEAQSKEAAQSNKGKKERPEKHGEVQARSAPASTSEIAPITQSGLRRTLQHAGFQDIRIVDAAYLVQARTEDGDDVIMFINPPLTQGPDKADQSPKR
jgi:hypothetical protein